MSDNAEPYMQRRCPHCKGEVYALAVYDFSLGNHPCTVCGKKSRPMTKWEYFDAMHAIKQDLHDQKNEQP